MQDFTGFSFDHIHSSRLGILRVSDGDGYKGDLLPEFENATAEVRGLNELYYFGSDYKSKPIELSIAYDSMTEQQFRQLRRWLSIKTPSSLIFDERPYKAYTAKIESPPSLDYICFDEPRKYAGTPRDGVRVVGREPKSDTEYTVIREQVTPWVYELDESGKKVVYERIYKGSGTINFVCYYPLAKAPFKILDLYGDFKIKKHFPIMPGESPYYENNPRPIKTPTGAWDWSQMNNSLDYIDYGNPYTIYNNVEEWAESSGIMPYSVYLENNIDKVIPETETNIYSYMIPVFNPGDVDTPFSLFIPYAPTTDTSYGTITPINDANEIIIDAGGNEQYMVLKPITAKKEYQYENGIMINTRNHLIEGVNYNQLEGKWETTGEIYNEFIKRGDFGKITRSMLFYPFDDLTQAIYVNVNTYSKDMQIHYSYLYY